MVTLVALVGLAAQDLRVSSDFPGGSALVEGIDGPVIRVLPAARPDRGWVCWWYFKVEGLAPGEKLALDVGGGVWATPDRAFWSVDDREWKQTPPGERGKSRIRYTVEARAKTMWFAWGPPFVLRHAREAVEEGARASPHAKVFELARSRDGHSVPALRVSQPGAPDSERLGIWVQARQHAWESGGSWVCRGFLDWAVSDDPRAEALRKKAVISIVPVMDADNAERGAGGKEQKPQDHNRDWSAEPHWPEVRAAQAEIRKLDADGRFDFFIDLHNPAAGDKSPFFFVPPASLLSEKGKRNLDRFLAAAREEIAGPLRYKGLTKESGPSYDKNWEKISKNWVARNTRDHVLALTLETSWNTPESTAENYRRVGRELGLSIERAFREPGR
jgi:hypothetical protein